MGEANIQLSELCYSLWKYHLIFKLVKKISVINNTRFLFHGHILVSRISVGCYNFKTLASFHFARCNGDKNEQYSR